MKHGAQDNEAPRSGLRQQRFLPEPTPPETAAKLHELLATLWVQSQGLIAERISALKAAQQSLQRDQHDPELRQQAAAEAHKLAGVLGTFGLPRGTDLARDAETLLASEVALSPEQLAALRLWILELQEMVELKYAGVPSHRA